MENTGSGIPEGECNAVFETGYTTSSTGTGLGLNIVEQLTDRYGWEVAIIDGSDGGARFERTGLERVSR